MRRALKVASAALAVVLAASAAAGCGLLKKSYGLGETVKGAKVDLKVTGVRFAREVTGFFPAVAQPKAGYLWAFVDMEVTNTQKASVEPYDGFVVYLTTKDGKDCQSGPPIMANGPSDFKNLGSIQSLKAGGSDTGSVAFYVKEGTALGGVRLSSFDYNKRDVTIALPGIVAEAAKEGVIALGKEGVVDGVGLTVHGIRKVPKYSYKTGILTNSLTPQTGNVFLEVDMSVRNVGRAAPLAVGKDILGNEVVTMAPDSPGAGKLFLIGSDKKWAGPMGSVGLFREEMMPKPLWWKVEPLAKGASARAWLPFNVPDGQTLTLQLRMPRLGPPLEFALE